ncbi:MAG: hypothetical protein RR581_06890 [Eubacterium sp.]
MERKVYSSWAFSENEREKSEINYLIYQELMSKYRVYRNDLKPIIVDKEDCDFENYDVVIGRKPGYHHSVYTIYKNSPKLSISKLALLCDGGNLCFGYSMKGEKIYVFED